MEEKIKIYITQNIYDILLKDMDFFEFYKIKGQINKNDFLNTLIINYYETYQARKNELFDEIKNNISINTNCKEYEVIDLTNKVISLYDNKTYNFSNSKFDRTISIKPTKDSISIINYIQNELIKGNTMSNYFRVMFASYCLLPQDKREQIIFKQQYEAINEAIKNDRQIYFHTKGKNIKHIVSPYSISNSKEELFNYLIGQSSEKIYTFRLTRIKKVIILNEKRVFSGENIYAFNKMMKYGPQYIYLNNEETCVRLSKKGQELFKKMYIHRPFPIKIDNDLYYFDCSHEQITQYFSRFGKSAFIEYPTDLRDKMKDFYYTSYISYKKNPKGSL